MSNRFFPNYDSYIVTSRFGMRFHPVDKVQKMHNGIDMTATNNGKTGQIDDIMAHTGGTVEAVGYDSSAGYFINIRVDKETTMHYFHMKNQSPFKVDDTVKQGDIIGRMGKTGKVTAAHLHWGIKKNGKWIDPEPYLNADYPVLKEEPKKDETKLVSIQMPVLRPGDKNEQVKTMQELLLARGYKMTSTDGKTTYGADGSFGGATKRAFGKFQEDNKLEKDYHCGPASWAVLMRSPK